MYIKLNLLRIICLIVIVIRIVIGIAFLTLLEQKILN